MEQMKIDAEAMLPFDFTRPEISEAVRTLKPVVFLDGDAFYSLLGPDPAVGVFGCGCTPDDAVKDWEINLEQIRKDPCANKEVLTHVNETLSASKRNV
jgi:hypothetical protein